MVITILTNWLIYPDQFRNNVLPGKGRSLRLSYNECSTYGNMARVCSGADSRDLGLGVETAPRGKVEPEVGAKQSQRIIY